MRHIRRVACAISGGVDSSVAAYLLKKKGYEVIGVFMRNWDIADETGQCLADKDCEDAQYSCQHIGIPFQEVNFVKQYWNEVFCNLVEDYKNGITPNPDILCNKKIKFGVFWKEVIRRLDVDAIGTGHYAQNSFGEDLENYDHQKGARLLQSIDKVKDQTFFLSQIPQQILQRTLFPVGGLTKDVVRQIASEIGLSKIVKKKESTGICFIGLRNFQKFINEYVEPKFGNFIDIETGSVVGQHTGMHNWTLGQRCRLQNKKVKYFVAKKQPPLQDIFVAPGSNHPSLYADSIVIEKPYWINGMPKNLIENMKFDCMFKFQQVDPLVKCCIEVLDNNQYLVKIEKPLKALTPGQYAVFYFEEECLGSGRIIYPGPSMYDLQMNSQNCISDTIPS